MDSAQKAMAPCMHGRSNSMDPFDVLGHLVAKSYKPKSSLFQQQTQKHDKSSFERYEWSQKQHAA